MVMYCDLYQVKDLDEVYVAGRRMQLDKVDGDLVIEDGSVEASSREGIIIVNGSLKCIGDCYVLGSLETNDVFSTRGDLKIDGELKTGKIEVKHGSLLISGRLEATDVQVQRELIVEGDAVANYINSGRSLVWKQI